MQDAPGEILLNKISFYSSTLTALFLEYVFKQNYQFNISR